jgi:Na+/melibiose symporter-like transporter
VTAENSATLLWAVRLLFVEAAGLAVLTAYLLVQDVIGHADSVPVAIALTVLAAIGVVFVYFVARALSRRSAGRRSSSSS